jgi:hypothetical protein
MATRTITHLIPTYSGEAGGVVFTNGSGTVDDATVAGQKAIAWATRAGLGISGGPAARDLTPAQGEPVENWTDAQRKAYLDSHKVAYPSAATTAELKAAIKDGIDMKAQGGSAPNLSGGRDSGTYPPLDGKPVSNPAKPDDADKAHAWKAPRTGVSTSDVAPVVTLQPSASSKVAPATATYTITVTGTPTPSIQWQRQTRGGGAYNDIPGATGLSYTTPALSVAENHNDRYRARVVNSDGVVYTNAVQQAVT